MARPSIPAHIREQQINELPNIRFVRWDGPYKGAPSKAVCRCEVDGYEWATSVHSLLAIGSGCPQCAGKRRWTAEERIEQINSISNIRFIRWVDHYKNGHSKAVCRCEVDDFEWSPSVDNLLIKGSGCPSCSGQRRWTAEERIAQINTIPNIRFVRWGGPYKNHKSKAVIRCSANHEWSASVDNLLNSGTGCPSCAKSGFDKNKDSTLYFLRSECGAMVKIGVSNNHAQRHRILRHRTPFGWSCIELIHGRGSLIAELEKGLHGKTEQVEFSETFDGHTEWRKWTPEIPKLMREARIAADVAR